MQQATETTERAVMESVAPQACGCGGGGGAPAAPPAWVYCIGNLRPAFSSLSLEKAFGQAVGASGTDVPDFALEYQILSQAENLYLTKQMCWVMAIDGGGNSACTDAYLVKARSYRELYGMLAGIQPNETEAGKRFDVMIGPRGPMAPPAMCAGLQLPLVVCNQLYSFTRDEFVAAVAAKIAGSDVPVNDIDSLFSAMLALTDNAGETDEHRAVNYLTLRYPDIYIMAGNMLGHGSGPYLLGGVYTLDGIVAKPAPVQGARRIIDVIFHYRSRSAPATVSWYCEVDTTGQFPFLVRPISRYFAQS